MIQGCRPLKELVLDAASTVLVRVDFNVPLEEGKITDDTRIRAALETIRYLLARQARLILISHLGNPKGIEPDLSLKPISQRLSELLNQPVCFLGSLEEAFKELAHSSHQLFLMENLRFFAGEKKPQEHPGFIQQLASLGSAYVNDAFGTAHREDGSCVSLVSHFKGRCAFGFLIEKEIEFLQHHFEQPQPPFIAIVGGAKVSSKLNILQKLLDRCDKLVIVGAMAYTFLVAQGINVASSLYESDSLESAKAILQKAQKLKKPLLLPQDTVVCDHIENASIIRLIPTDRDFPENMQGVDIGPQTLIEIASFIKEAKTIFWNGPAGVFEKKPFATGTEALAEMLSQSQAVTIVGGGDSTAAVNQMGLAKSFSHVSTGGGASLELIEKGDLPALKALREFY
jgi:phosphoglycerate kinase